MLQTMVFSKKMGAALADVPLFGTAFNNWFPVVVLFWCGALFLNVWQVIARFILPSRFQFQESGSNEHLERGQVLIRKEQACPACTLLMLPCVLIIADCHVTFSCHVTVSASACNLLQTAVHVMYANDCCLLTLPLHSKAFLRLTGSNSLHSFSWSF